MVGLLCFKQQKMGGPSTCTHFPVLKQTEFVLPTDKKKIGVGQVLKYSLPRATKMDVNPFSDFCSPHIAHRIIQQVQVLQLLAFPRLWIWLKNDHLPKIYFGCKVGHNHKFEILTTWASTRTPTASFKPNMATICEVN